MKLFYLFMIFSLALSNALYAFLSDEEYVDLVMKSASVPLFMPKESDIKQDQKELFETYKTGFSARCNLFSQGIDECLPKLYDFWSDPRYTNTIVVLRDLDGESITQRSFYSAIDLHLNFISGLYFGFSTKGHIAFLWMKGDLDDPIISDSYYKYFWWYEGRHYLPEIWNNWLNCWRLEQNLEKPRKTVEQELISEITGFGFHIFPYLYRELKLGDKSMNKVLKKLSEPARGSFKFEDFLTWWEKNQVKFSFPKPEGYDKVRSRLLLGPLSKNKTLLRDMDRWQKNIKEFYTDPNNLKENYWYYKIGDKNISAEEISAIKQNYKGEESNEKNY